MKTLRTHRHHFFIAAALLLGVGAFCVTGFYVYTATHSGPNVRVLAAAGYWEERIRLVGGAAAYEEFAQSVAKESLAKQHGSAHAFGTGLYKALGIKGFTVCGTRFSMGCMHEFSSWAIATGGIASVYALDQLCLDTYLDLHDRADCEHSIGHGLIAYFGYDERALQGALSLCGKIPTQDSGVGCRVGVFMEYNERFFLGPDRTLRALDPNDPYTPCDTVSSSDQKECVYLQPKWWWKVATSSDPFATFTQIGGYCNHLTENDPTIKQACYQGVGYAAVWGGNFAATTTGALCDSASKGADRLTCREYAAFTLGGLINTKASVLLCGPFTGMDQKDCMAYALQDPAIREGTGLHPQDMQQP